MIHPCDATLQDFLNAPDGNRTVCSGCFEDPDLRDWIRNHGSAAECDFCSGRTGVAIPLAAVVLHVMDCICFEYGSEQQNLFVDSNRFPYSSAETWNTEELLFEELALWLPNDSRGQLRSAIVSQIGNWVWREVEWNSYAAEGCSILSHTWEKFCDLVRHRKRFFFVPGANEEPEAKFAYVNVREVLEGLREVGEREGWFRQVPAGTQLYRAEMEDPQAGFPLQRDDAAHKVLNPPGIPALYAAESLKSAISTVTTPGYYAVATYRVTSALSVLDLTAVADVPGIFENPQANLYRRRYLVLAHKLRDAITGPPEDGPSAVLKYLPTQVVSEYFRVSIGGPTHGIRYPGISSTLAPRLVVFEECTSSNGGTERPLENLVLEEHVEHIRWEPQAVTGS